VFGAFSVVLLIVLFFAGVILLTSDPPLVRSFGPHAANDVLGRVALFTSAGLVQLAIALVSFS
jgi:hypothetical protein